MNRDPPSEPLPRAIIRGADGRVSNRRFRHFADLIFRLPVIGHKAEIITTLAAFIAHMPPFVTHGLFQRVNVVSIDPANLAPLFPDEIPQFLNVLAGQMSLIGIRPDTPDWLEKYNGHERVILTVKPGITGYNQAYFRNSADGETKLRNDVYYAEHISFWFDVKIFFKTIKTVLFRENINVDEDRK